MSTFWTIFAAYTAFLVIFTGSVFFALGNSFGRRHVKQRQTRDSKGRFNKTSR